MSVGAYAIKNITALAGPGSSSVTFSKRSLINSGGRAARVVGVLPASPFFPAFLSPHSTLQYTKKPAWPKAECPLRRVSCRSMTSQPSRSYTLKTSSPRPTPCVPSTAIVRTLCVATVISHPRVTCSIPPFALTQKAPLCSASPPPFACQYFSPICDLFSYSPFPIPVPSFCFGLATWVQPSHSASPVPSSVSGAILVLTYRLLSSFPLSAAVRQFWYHDRWYGRSDLWIQLTVHRQRHRLCR